MASGGSSQLRTAPPSYSSFSIQSNNGITALRYTRAVLSLERFTASEANTVLGRTALTLLRRRLKSDVASSSTAGNARHSDSHPARVSTPKSVLRREGLQILT